MAKTKKARKTRKPPQAVAGTLDSIRPLLTINETATALRCGVTKTYELIGTGKLECLKLGDRSLVLASSVDRLIKSLPRFKPSVPTQGVQR